MILRPRALLTSLLVALVGLTALAGTASAAEVGPTRQTTVAASATPESPVVIAGVAGLEWSDLDRTRTPNLWRLVGDGDVASIAVRTLAPTCPVDAWLTMSAGSRVTGARETGPATGTETDSGALRCRSVPGVVEQASDLPQRPGTVMGWDNLSAPPAGSAALGQPGSLGRPGTLGDALAQAGVCSAAFGPGAAVALATSGGHVAHYAAALSDDPTVLRAELTACPVSVVDLGELPDPGVERANALHDLDAKVGMLDAAVPGEGTLIVAGIADTPLGPRGLQVAVARAEAGRAAAPSWLSSASSRREGVILTNDLTATIADAVGVHPEGLDGAPVQRGQARGLDVGATVDNRQYLTTLSDVAPPMNWAVLGLLGLVVLLCVPVVLRRRGVRAGEPGHGTRNLAVATLTVAACLPAAASLATLTRWWSSAAPGPVLAAGVAVPAVLLALVATALDRPLRRLLPDPAWARPLALSALTWVVLTIDGLTGTTLQQGSPLGPSLAEGARFYGFGNTVYAVYSVSGVVLAAGLSVAVRGRAGKRVGLIVAAAVAVVTVAVDGLPQFGADAGGIVSLVPAFAVLLIALSGRRLGVRMWLAVVAATAFVVGAIALMAWLVPNGSHLGRFVQRLVAGDAMSLVTSKMAGAWATVATVPGVIAVIAVVLVAWAVLAPGRRPWGRIDALNGVYAAHPALRATVIALVVVAGFGSALNDTGVAVAIIVGMLALAVLATGRWVEQPPVTARAVRADATRQVAVGGAMLLVFLLVAGMAPPTEGRGFAGGSVAASPLAPGAAVGTTDSPLVVIGTSGLRWPDVQPEGAASVLSRMLADGADAGGVSLPVGRAARCAEGGWLALSAGTLAEVSVAGGPCPALDVQPAGASGASVTGWQELVALQQGSAFGAHLGTLGQALHGPSVCTTAVGPGAAVALAGKDGTVARYRTLEQATADGSDAFVCPVTVVDAGGVDPTLPDRDTQVAQVSATVGSLLSAAPADATVVVVDVAPVPGARPALGVALVRSPSQVQDRPRFLSSTSTRTDGVARLLDLPATMLAAAGLPVPSAIIDSPLVRSDVRPADAGATAQELADVTARDFVRRSTYSGFVDYPFWVGLALAALCWAAGTVPALRRRVTAPARRAAEVVALLLAAFPAASFLNGLTSWWTFGSPTVALWLGTALMTVVVAGLAAIAPRRPVWSRVAVISGITFVVLTLDGVLGTPLNRTSPLGSAPTFGARFFGFGNPTFSVYAVTGLLFAAALAQPLVHGGRRRLAAAVVGVIGAVAMIVDVWPAFGADLGGGLVLVPAFVIVGMVASGSRVTVKRFLLVAAAGVGVVALVGVLDWLRPPTERTHLGNFVGQVIDGDAWAILYRKGVAALQSVTGGPTVWVTLAICVLAAVPLLGTAAARARWTPRWFARSEAAWPLLRPAVLAIWVAAVAGSLVNDFGLRIAMIAVIPAVPLLLLPALSADDEDGLRGTV